MGWLEKKWNYDLYQDILWASISPKGPSCLEPVPQLAGSVQPSN